MSMDAEELKEFIKLVRERSLLYQSSVSQCDFLCGVGS